MAETQKGFFKEFRSYTSKCNPSDFARPVATKQARAISKVSTKEADSYLKSQTYFYKNDALRQSNASLLAYQNSRSNLLSQPKRVNDKFKSPHESKRCGSAFISRRNKNLEL